MVTEIKIDASPNENYRREMEALFRESAAESAARPEADHLAPGGEAAQRPGSVGRDVEGKGESAASLQTNRSQVRPEAARPAHEESPEERIDMHEVLARQMGMEYVDLSDVEEADLEALRMLNADQARQYKALPLHYDDESDTLTVAIADPSDPTVVDNLSLALGRRVRAVVGKEDDIVDLINRHYGIGEETIESLLGEAAERGDEDVLRPAGNVIDLSDLSSIEHEKNPVRKATNLILLKAISDHASDIHFEPFEKLLRVRYRVDGVLREMDSPPKDMQLGIISRLKVMADLDIAESRRPQDGRINLLLPEEREVELRVTSAPTVHGEGMVMRVLDKSMMQMGISQLGMSEDVLEEFLKEINKRHGIVLVTGPTGSGKTTTLYAALNAVKNSEDKLITTEDPVEYQVDGIIQVNINQNVGLTYARCLRAILRQDPDRILVGEIRDLETGKISVESALTGHLVFSTLHTNSAAATITRLVDMGIEPFLIAATLQAVVGQRLVRTICPACRRPYEATDDEIAEFGVTRQDVEDIEFYEGAGCEECAHTGYRGRIGVYEFLKVNEKISDLILSQATSDELHEQALADGMIALRQDGWIKICMGVTTFSEVLAHTPSDQSATKTVGNAYALE